MLCVVARPPFDVVGWRNGRFGGDQPCGCPHAIDFAFAPNSAVEPVIVIVASHGLENGLQDRSFLRSSRGSADGSKTTETMAFILPSSVEYR